MESSRPTPFFRPSPGGFLLRYGFAVLSVGLILAFRWVLHPVLGSRAPLLAFVAAVLLTAVYGGLGPGLVATVASLLAGSYFFFSPEGELGWIDPASRVHAALFAGIGVMISVLSHLLRRAQEEIRGLARDLEHRVEERTAELEEANQALEAFSYSVSHDLRAPLRGMQGFAQALLEDYGERLDERGHDYADRIVAAGGRMEALINDLLAYGRLSRAQVDVQRVALSPAVEEARRQLGADLSRKGGRIGVEEPLPAVLAHRPTLVQVLANLLSNAVKFVPEGRAPEVRVWATHGGGRVCLSVADNGIGIAPEHQARVFNVFERLHGMETYPGTGIGLAIVRKAVERMGGRAGVESEPGRGSRFWIDLPAAPEER